MISLAILGLLQALFLPGFLVASLITKSAKLPLADRALIATPLSLVLNYFLISLLLISHAYTRIVMLSICGLELLALLALAISYWQASTHKTFCSPNSQTNETNHDSWLLIILFNVVAPGILITIYSQNAGSVFERWDAITSWNRWAKDWFNQQVKGSMGYPQAVPILFSIVYKFAGTTNIQTVSKLVTDYYPFFGLFCFWRLIYMRKDWAVACSLAGLAYVYFIALGMDSGFVFSGYVDPVMAALGAFMLYALFVTERFSHSLLTKGKGIIALLAICTTSLALVKQSGVPAMIMYAFLVAYALKTIRGKDLLYFIIVGAICLFISCFWYVFSYFHWHDFVRAESSLIRPVILRPQVGFIKLTSALGIIPVIIATCSIFLNRNAFRIFTFFVIPLFLFWAFLVSYDIRTAFIFFPWLAFLVGLALAKVLDIKTMGYLAFAAIVFLLLREQYTRITDQKFSLPDLAFWCAVIYLTFFFAKLAYQYCLNKLPLIAKGTLAIGLISALLVVLILLPNFFPATTFLYKNTLLRIMANDQGFNFKIDEIFTREPQAKLLSNWQIIYNIPTIEERFVPVAGYSTEIIYKWLSRTDVAYFLQWSPPNGCQPEETREILHARNISFREEKLANDFFLFEKK